MFSVPINKPKRISSFKNKKEMKEYQEFEAIQTSELRNKNVKPTQREKLWNKKVIFESVKSHILIKLKMSI